MQGLACEREGNVFVGRADVESVSATDSKSQPGPRHLQSYSRESPNRVSALRYVAARVVKNCWPNRSCICTCVPTGPAWCHPGSNLQCVGQRLNSWSSLTMIANSGVSMSLMAHEDTGRSRRRRGTSWRLLHCSLEVRRSRTGDAEDSRAHRSWISWRRGHVSLQMAMQ
jgi:hypothetical protein